MAEIAFYHDDNAPVQPDQYAVEFSELLLLYRTLKPKRVLEIGTRSGGTLWQWVGNAPEGALVLGVDLPIGPWDEPGSIDYKAIWNAAKKTDRCVMSIIGNSHHPLTVKAVRSILPEVDFLFIDGDHGERGAYMDYLTYGSMVRANGIIAFHDILHDPDNPGIEVYKVWELLKGDDSVELISAPGQTKRGIGVLYAR